MVYANYEHWKSNPLEGEPYLSIVIPAYNEERRIIPTVGAIASHVSNLGVPWELIVADDGSTDSTVELLQNLDLVNLRVLIAEENGGKGSAVRRGMLAARGEYILFTDADNSTPIENIDAVLKKLTDEDYDVAVGSRAAEGASENNKSLFRKIMSWGLRFLVRYFLNVPVKDTQCGFKMYTREAAHKLHAAQTIDSFSYDLENLYLARKWGYRIAEVPVNWMDAPGSKVNAKKVVLRFLQDMVWIRWQDVRGVYNEPNHIVASDLLGFAIDEDDNSDPKRPLSVAIVTPYPPSKSSLNEYGYHFIEALRTKDEVGCIYILTDELPEGHHYPHIQGEGATTVIVPCWRFGALNNAPRIQKTVTVLQPDVVLFNIQFASFASTRVAGALGLFAPLLVKKRLKIPTIVLLHNIMETVDLSSAGFGSNALMERLTRFAGSVMTRLLLQADLVALTIPKYVDTLREKYKAQNVFLSPHGSFDEIPMPTFSEHNNGHLQIMTFGKFGTYKRVEKLIEAYDCLRRQPREQTLTLVIAGSNSPNVEGYLEGVRDTYAKVPNVVYTGYVPEEDVQHVFQESDVVVFPYTSTTGSSGVLHQAGSYGRAVVLPDIGDFSELIKDEGYTGEFFEPANADSLAEAIDALLRDPQKRSEQGRQNYRASVGVPIADVVDWYLIHLNRYLKQN